MVRVTQNNFKFHKEFYRRKNAIHTNELELTSLRGEFLVPHVHSRCSALSVLMVLYSLLQLLHV